MTQKPQSTRFDDVAVDGGGASIKGSIELDQNGEFLNAAFPVYQPSGGDKASLKAERVPDGPLKVTMRADIYDGRSFIKSIMGGSASDSKSRRGIADQSVMVVLAGYLQESGDSARAVQVLEAVIAAHPDYAEAYNSLGVIEGHRGRHD